MTEQSYIQGDRKVTPYLKKTIIYFQNIISTINEYEKEV